MARITEEADLSTPYASDRVRVAWDSEVRDDVVGIAADANGMGPGCRSR